MNLSTLSVYHLPIYLSNLAFRYIMRKSLALVLIYKSTILLFDCFIFHHVNIEIHNFRYI